MSRLSRVHSAAMALVALGLLAAPVADAEGTHDSQHYALEVDILTRGLDHPWGLAFLPDGRMLVTERPGRLRLLAANGTPIGDIGGLPANLVAFGQGGLLDVALHPDFADNGWIYLSYAGHDGSAAGTELARARLANGALTDLEVLFRLLPKTRAGQHFGGRIVFDGKGHVYLTLGDRGDRDRAQDGADHAGSIVRLLDDGRVPPDNPFVGRSGMRPEIYSLGNRNVQGAAWHAQSGALWAHEHGPQGGDEVNVIHAGKNYGWPVITYGVNYGIGTSIGEGTRKPGLEQPLHFWDPSIAPSGMAIYQGDKFPRWQGNVLVGALKFRLLARLETDGSKVTHEERMLKGVLGRIRDVRVGPDGYVYLLTDEADGVLARISPAR